MDGGAKGLRGGLETQNYRRVTHRSCEFFPCHKGVPEDTYNCLFCFCPLYLLKDQCGGNFRYLKNGIKDCTNCSVPHGPDSYDRIMEKMDQVMEGAKMLPEDL
jgi:Zn-finger protein